LWAPPLLRLDLRGGILFMGTRGPGSGTGALRQAQEAVQKRKAWKLRLFRCVIWDIYPGVALEVHIRLRKVKGNWLG